MVRPCVFSKGWSCRRIRPDTELAEVEGAVATAYIELLYAMYQHEEMSEMDSRGHRQKGKSLEAHYCWGEALAIGVCPGPACVTSPNCWSS
jgi:hypothetical protein